MKDKIIEILEKRIKDAFSNGFQNYERRQLEQAIIAIRDYVPPIYFDKLKDWEGGSDGK